MPSTPRALAASLYKGGVVYWATVGNGDSDRVIPVGSMSRAASGTTIKNARAAARTMAGPETPRRFDAGLNKAANRFSSVDGRAIATAGDHTVPACRSARAISR